MWYWAVAVAASSAGIAVWSYKRRNDVEEMVHEGATVNWKPTREVAAVGSDAVELETRADAIARDQQLSEALTEIENEFSEGLQKIMREFWDGIGVDARTELDLVMK